MKRLLALVCAVLTAALWLTGCGKVDISGVYKLTSLNASAYDWSLDESLSMLDDIILTVSGEEATLTMPDEKLHLTVDLHKKTLKDENGLSAPYDFDGGTLTLTSAAGSVMVFERIGEAPEPTQKPKN